MGRGMGGIWPEPKGLPEMDSFHWQEMWIVWLLTVPGPWLVILAQTDPYRPSA